MHDPDEPGALVLYLPTQLSATEKLTANLCKNLNERISIVNS
ncbi:hypothetical protein Pmani_016017 [Petrolisthes manimaculis]|uniref:Uncharacterized protein n=1 Tax=Petrolisthes manimaculis TaxID=1843537 RepID=A0AAE1PSH7_9EUCA|nr:hypothetical protein Pmani_016017 [Petrolisthes manimaculis]